MHRESKKGLSGVRIISLCTVTCYSLDEIWGSSNLLEFYVLLEDRKYESYTDSFYYLMFFLNELFYSLIIIKLYNVLPKVVKNDFFI